MKEEALLFLWFQWRELLRALWPWEGGGLSQDFMTTLALRGQN
jgi:hypothetical protein